LTFPSIGIVRWSESVLGVRPPGKIFARIEEKEVEIAGGGRGV